MTSNIETIIRDIVEIIVRKRNTHLLHTVYTKIERIIDLGYKLLDSNIKEINKEFLENEINIYKSILNEISLEQKEPKVSEIKQYHHQLNNLGLVIKDIPSFSHKSRTYGPYRRGELLYIKDRNIFLKLIESGYIKEIKDEIF